MLNKVYGRNGFVLDTPDGYENEKGRLIYRDISALEITIPKTGSIKYCASKQAAVRGGLLEDAQTRFFELVYKINNYIQNHCNTGDYDYISESFDEFKNKFSGTLVIGKIGSAQEEEHLEIKKSNVGDVLNQLGFVNVVNPPPGYFSAVKKNCETVSLIGRIFAGIFGYLFSFFKT